METLYWIAGVIGCLIAVWLFIQLIAFAILGRVFAKAFDAIFKGFTR